MANTYTLPDFNSYYPKKLIRLSNRIIEEENNKQFLITEERIEKSIRKLDKNEKLLRRDIKVLAYRLDEVEKRDLLEIFLKRAKEFYGTVQKMYFQVKALIFSFYNLYGYRELYNVIKLGVNNNTRWKEEAEYIKDIINEAKSYEEFIRHIYGKLIKCTSIEEFNDLLEKLFIKKESEILRQFLPKILKQKVESGEIFENYEYYEYLMDKYIPWESYREIFEEILLSLKDYNLENLEYNQEVWLKYIGNKFGDPYGLMKSKWIGMNEDAKLVFQKWKTLKNITVFFSEISGDRKRLAFWKRFADYFYRVEYFSNYENALLMETKNHVFVEFARIGALYMYDKEDVNIQKVADEKYFSKNRIVREYLKNPDIALVREVHSKGWQNRFIRRFEQYGYYL